MTNISTIETYGANSFIKAAHERPRVQRINATGHLAFTVTTDHSRYIVRLALESDRPLAECVRANSGEPCKGFSTAKHCFHVGSVLLSISKETSNA